MIALSHVTQRYGRTVVFEDVSLTLGGPGVTLILGPNGSGKTTLVRCLLGLEPIQGEITWDGEPFRPAERRAYPVFDDVPFYPRLTGRQNLLLLSPGAAGKPSPFVDDHLLKARVSSYSYGQRKRLALAAALGSGATTLLLDEPTNGLDADGLSTLRETMSQSAPARSYLVTSHQTGFFAGLATRAVIIAGRKLRSFDVTSMDGKEIDRVYDDARAAGSA